MDNEVRSRPGIAQNSDNRLKIGLAIGAMVASYAMLVACSTSSAPQNRLLLKPVNAQVTSVLGTAQMVYKGIRTPLAAGAEVASGNEVEVGESSAVEFGFHGVFLHLGSSSSLYVLQATRVTPAWQLQVVVSGSCHASVPKDVRLIVYAGRAVVTAATAASFDANSGANNQSLALKVDSGSVSVAGLGGKAVVHAGRTASVAAPTPDRPRPVPVVVS